MFLKEGGDILVLLQNIYQKPVWWITIIHSNARLIYGEKYFSGFSEKQRASKQESVLKPRITGKVTVLKKK